MSQFLEKHEAPPPLGLVSQMALSEADQRSNGISSKSSVPSLPPQPSGKGAVTNGGLPAGGGLPDFLAAALSAARSNGTTQPQASGDAQGGSSECKAVQGGLPDLLGSVLAAVRNGQQGAASARSSGSAGGMAGMLSAALAGGLQEVAKVSGDSSSGARQSGDTSAGGGLPTLPPRGMMGRPL